MITAFLNNLFYAITSLIKHLFSSFLKTEIEKLNHLPKRSKLTIMKSVRGYWYLSGIPQSTLNKLHVTVNSGARIIKLKVLSII